MRLRTVISVAALLALAFAIGGCGSGLKHKPTLSGQTTTLNLGLPKRALDAPVTGSVPGDQVLHVAAVLKVNEAVLNELSAKAKKVAKGSGSVPLKKLGVSDDDIKKIQDYFSGGNIQVRPSKTNTAVRFDAKASVVGRLLQTTFVNHQLNGRTFYTPDPAHLPKIPKEIANYILAVTGLDTYSITPKRATVAGATIARAKNGNCADLNSGQFAGPARLASYYGYDRLYQQGLHGEGMTVNLIEQDGFHPSDVQNYLACTGSQTQVDTVRLGSDPQDLGETALDMEMIAGLAPRAHIVDYQMDGAQVQANWWTAMIDDLQAVVDANSAHPDTGGVLSISFQSEEDQISGDARQAMDANLRILAQAEHVTIFASSGDCGAFMHGVLDDPGMWGRNPMVSFPASSPYVVGVGGTTMRFNGSRVSETTWSDQADKSKCDNRWGSGGGVSSVYPRPDYQQGPRTDQKYSNGNRGVPDVAAVADTVPAFEGNRWVGTGGTSAACPIVAAGMALMNEGTLQRRHGFYYGPETFYWVYNHAGGKTPFHDVTTGNNGWYRAGPGWDATTGMGTPWLPDLYNILLAAG